MATLVPATGRTLLTRELRQMVLVSAYLENRDLGGTVAEITYEAAKPEAAGWLYVGVGGQYLSQRRVPGAARGAGHRVRAGVRGPGDSLPLVRPAVLILAAAPLSLAGALLRALAATGTELNVSSAMGLVLLIGRGEERDRAARLCRTRTRARHRARRSRLRPARCGCGNPDDDAVHAVRAGSAGAGDRAEPNCGGRSRSPSSELALSADCALLDSGVRFDR